MYNPTVESALVETMHKKKSFQADSVAVKKERHPCSLPHFLCSSRVAGHSLWPSGSFPKFSTRSNSVQESSTRLFRQSKMTSILLVELYGSPLSPSAHPHVLAANACTFYRSDVSQFEKSNSSSESIS